MSRLRWTVLLAFLSALFFLLFPHGPILYHQEMGIRLLAHALLKERGGERNFRLLFFDPLLNVESQTLAGQAIYHFQFIIFTNPTNVQAYRWLGRNLMLLDKPDEAVKYYSSSIRLHPRDFFSYWEMGLAYEKLAEGLIEEESLIKQDDKAALVETILSTPVVSETTEVKTSVNQMVTIWQAGGITAQQLIEFGNEARKQGMYEEALKWYERAIWMQPDLGYSWYYMGLTFQEQQLWGNALDSYSRALESKEFNYNGKSDIYFNMGLIYHDIPEYRDINKALQMYNDALDLDIFSSDNIEADTFYRRGEIYRWQGRIPQDVILEYQRALSLNPEHYWARLHLGYALYQTYRDVYQAEIEIRRSIASWPHDDRSIKWAYRDLGDIYRDAGLCKDAIIAYQEVLRLDPYDTQVKSILGTLACE